ncbi:phasin family protein [Paraburkholderia sp. GAS199]|uniref:phasin family protein n=1 Tax=Paraburkholderia sp. GAS199 TaxID=3035126 RepID=UPI003D2187A6
MPHLIDASFDVAYNCISEAFAGFEALVQPNNQTIRTSLSEQRAVADAALSAETFSEVIDLSTWQLSAAVTKTFAYWRHVEYISVQMGIHVVSAAHERLKSRFRPWQGVSTSRIPA